MPFRQIIRLICSTVSCLNFSCRQSYSMYHVLYRNVKLVEENQKPVFRSENIFSEKFSKELTSRLKQNGHVYVLDLKGAESIAYHLTKDWNGYILEANPGPGILTKAILKMSSCHLRVFEKNEEFLTPLEAMSSEHSNLEVVKEDFMFLPAIEARTDCEESENLFKDIPICSWSNGISFRFFCIISSKKSVRFFRYLLAVLPERTSIFRYGRCEFFLLLTETEYRYIKAGPKENFATYRWSTVLYNLFFDIFCLQEIPSESLFPVPTSQKKNKTQNTSSFYFVKLVPKPDLFPSDNNPNKLPDLYYFVRHHLAKRTALVIPTLETWIPFCGPRLIKEGMNVFTKFGDLSPKQILMLFNQFSSWPEYEDSTFHAALQRYRSNNPFNDEDKDK
ncbi:dimethyladenosine transferase 2, mitochondrial-like [Uloborus diversus]|uniref:dimethyladenosine transferase 2, mitochondrial-like n=1 Tax=Uloborus diversus TaxID=327109 RepID=UPI0024092F41|nr:dimethyladenosine transferase 2, mitochondrial-like [Uloborus diversus]